MERQSYKQILDKLTGVDSWLSDLGFSQNLHRIHANIENIRKLEECWQDETAKKELINKIGHVELFWSLLEASEFADVYITLREHDQEPLREKLREVFKGPVVPSEESEISNIGRNVMFELNLASRLSQGGASIKLQTNPDIICETGELKIFIQCKRPFLERTIAKNINEAEKQLTRDLNGSNDKDARGVIAISVSRVLNPGDKMFIVDREDQLEPFMGNQVEILAKQSLESCTIKDTRTIGLIFHLITLAVVNETKLLTTAQQVVVLPRPDGDSKEISKLKKFSNFFR